jgi:hypothetical protein
MVPDETTLLTPDPGAIRADLEFMTARWGELDRRVMFEPRAIREGEKPIWAQFTVERIDEAIGWAVEQNKAGRNIYAVRNPIRLEHSGPAKDDSIAGRSSVGPTTTTSARPTTSGLSAVSAHGTV